MQIKKLKFGIVVKLIAEPECIPVSNVLYVLEGRATRNIFLVDLGLTSGALGCSQVPLGIILVSFGELLGFLSPPIRFSRVTRTVLKQ